MSFNVDDSGPLHRLSRSLVHTQTNVRRTRMATAAAKKSPPQKQSVLKKYGFAWVTLGFLVISLIGHWLFGWLAYVDEQQAMGSTVETGGYVIEMLRDTFENWQSEFLQLLWQVVGLTLLLYVGSPQSKDSEDRSEAILEEILRKVDPKGAEATLAEIDRQHPSR
jgi:hypothetical protein